MQLKMLTIPILFIGPDLVNHFMQKTIDVKVFKPKWLQTTYQQPCMEGK